MLVHNTVVNFKVHFIELVKLLSKFNKKLCALVEVKDKEVKEDKAIKQVELQPINHTNKIKFVAVIDVKAAHSLCECLSYSLSETESKTLLDLIKTLSYSEENKQEFQKIISEKVQPVSEYILS